MVTPFEVISHSAEFTQRVAQNISCLFLPGDLILLDGDLGAGKTCFVQGFINGLHSTDPVTSPTFSIAHFYRTLHFEILHIDLYRISNMDEFNDLGLVDYFGQSIVLIEWGIKFATCFEEFFIISFKMNRDNTRFISFSCRGDRYEKILDQIINRFQSVEEEVC